MAREHFSRRTSSSTQVCGTEKAFTCIAWQASKSTGMGSSGDRTVNSKEQWRGVLRHGLGTLFQKELIKYTGAHHSIMSQGRHSHVSGGQRAQHRHLCVRGQGKGMQGSMAPRAASWPRHAAPEGPLQVYRCASQHHKTEKTLKCIAWQASMVQAYLCAVLGQCDTGGNGTACCVMAMARCSRKTSFNTGADKVSYNLGE